MAKKRLERRKFKRFQMPTSSFAGLGPYFGKVGGIVDLSMGGLAFSYIGIEEPNGSSYLDVFLVDHDFYLRRVSFVTISDIAIVPDGHTAMTLRRRGVRFGKLTPRQRSQLENLIQNYAIGEA
ncbi:MAG: PilZ domain-containing protein, partial [Deltaproteobacteria bacterium]|nr:PilZ domain-containing protein [Deltaproteobacteria bacterium]